MIGDHPRYIRVIGQYAYIAVNYENAVAIVDISNPLAPTLVSKTGFADNQNRDLDVQGHYAYMAGYNSGTMGVLDISDPAAPIEVGHLTLPSQVESTLAAGRYVYASGDGDGVFSVVDVSNPATPTLIATTTVSAGVSGMAISGHYVYTASVGTSNLNVVDVSSSTADRGNHTFPPGGITYSATVSVNGRYLYLAGDKLDVFDISSATNPSLITALPNNNGFGGMFVSGRYAYAADNSGNLLIYDIRGTETSSLVAGNASIGQLEVSGNIVTPGEIQAAGGLNVGGSGIYSSAVWV